MSTAKIKPEQLGLDPVLRSKLTELQEEGFEIWRRFDVEVRQDEWHPFVPVDYEEVLKMLVQLRAPGLKFLEWGCATGVITIMADLLGYEAYGIELDGSLVTIARTLADKYGSNAQFAEGSFLPTGYEYRAADGDKRLGTIGHGRSGYLELNHPLEDFDVVYGYPWDGEADIMFDVMKRYGRADARLLIYGHQW
jgi:hypothetical protein